MPACSKSAASLKRGYTFPRKESNSTYIHTFKKIIKIYICTYACTYTVNQEIFMYENIHELNIRVNKLSRVPHENILTRICQVKITVHILPIKQLLATV